MHTNLITPKVVTIIFDDGESKSEFSDSPRYALLVDALRRNAPEDELRALADGQAYIRSWSCGSFAIAKNKVTWTKDPTFELHQALQDRLLEYAMNGFPADAFVKFLDRLLSNTSKRSIETFYGFIEQQGLTIDAEGFVIGYKGVNEKLRDVYSGQFDNSPGTRHKMDRRLVDDDPNHACSTGFHFGGWEYAHSFGPRMVLVKVDPKDLVCVPHDCSQGKVRTCEYEVLKEVTPESQMKALYEAGLIDDRNEREQKHPCPNGERECPACGSTCDAKDAYCHACGQPLPKQDEKTARLLCAECGTPVSDGASFCACCGARL